MAKKKTKQSLKAEQAELQKKLQAVTDEIQEQEAQEKRERDAKWQIIKNALLPHLKLLLELHPDHQKGCGGNGNYRDCARCALQKVEDDADWLKTWPECVTVNFEFVTDYPDPSPDWLEHK